MLGTLLLGGIIGIITAIVASLIALKIHQRSLSSTAIQQQGWEHAQEARQQQWEIQQEKRTAELEKKLSTNVRQVQQAWQKWEQKDAIREQTLKQQYEAITLHATLENEIEHLPHLEEASLPSVENQRHRATVSSTIPAQLQGVDLSGRDLSRRYLGGANLRGAKLAQANLFMTDLSEACLAGADLSGADLSGANLIGADLREATLMGASVLVADLNNAILFGTNLQKTRNLTMEQIATTLYDSTTCFDEDIDITLPSIPSIPKSVSSVPPTLQMVPSSYDIIRAQSLNAIPEPPSGEEPEQQFPLLSFPDLPETPFSAEDGTETPIPAWAPPSPSDDTLRILEELHLPAQRQEHRRTENFGTTTSSEKYHGRRRIKAS
ncbi:MAG: hypothetical protein NVS4B12_18160 [Ktedonobacteraceae bacterium]